MTMPRRRLGRQGLETSALGLGIMGISGVAGMPDMYGKPDVDEGIATIQRALRPWVVRASALHQPPHHHGPSPCAAPSS